MYLKDQKVYLKPNTVIEPLIDRWYAWTHLISPATASRNLTGRHLKIMNSYVQAPQVHLAAAKNPAMRGGPFMDFGANRKEAIVKLKQETLEKRANMIELSKAIDDLEELLSNRAEGYTMETLYEEVPEALQGFVELTYDLHNNPGYRFFESLLFESQYYDPSAQSIALWATENDERPFCLSTPRLDEPGVLHLSIPFNSPLIDKLGRMKREAGSLGELEAAFGLEEAQRALFHSFFTEEPPKPYARYAGDKIRMRYFGHACILIETSEFSILVDPLISYYGYPQEVAHYSDCDLPDRIDYVLVTHNHQDHILFETLLPMRHRIGKIIVPASNSGKLQEPDLKLMFENIGFDQVIEIKEMQKVVFNDCKITGVPFTGEHGDLEILSKLCYHVDVAGFSLMFAADSRILESKLYEHVHNSVGDVDVIFQGMECDGAPMSWLYGPLLPSEMPRAMDQTRRFSGSDCERGMKLVDIFNPSEVYVYAMGQEPWVEFISSVKYTDDSNPIVQSDKLIDQCRQKGIVAERLFGEKELLYTKRTAGVTAS